ncbi:MAG: response regulator [Nitrospira sp.]|jgi:CheY-like chemotaxis protein|nr:response regulator [Nitrospira sp.]
MSILIVEDNAVNAKLLALQLKGSGYRTIVADGGAAALEILRGPEVIELIITDFMMPEMNGLEMIGLIKAMPERRDLPILIASAYSDLHTVSKAKALGCQGFLVKPVEKAQLLKRVADLLKQDTLPVLQEKRHMMAKLGIDAEQYDDLARLFRAQLDAALPAVVLEQQDSDAGISENLGYLLKELAESAAFLGAEKFLRLYEQCKGNSLPKRSHGQALKEALQELDQALSACTKPSTEAPPSSAAA